MAILGAAANKRPRALKESTLPALARHLKTTTHGKLFYQSNSIQTRNFKLFYLNLKFTFEFEIRISIWILKFKFQFEFEIYTLSVIQFIKTNSLGLRLPWLRAADL